MFEIEKLNVTRNIGAYRRNQGSTEEAVLDVDPDFPPQLEAR